VEVARIMFFWIIVTECFYAADNWDHCEYTVITKSALGTG